MYEANNTYFTDYFVKLMSVALCPVSSLVYEYRVDMHHLTSAQVFVSGHRRYQLLKGGAQLRALCIGVVPVTSDF